MPWLAKRSLLTKVGVTTPFSPFRPRRSAWVNFAPAYAIESVAEPAPSFALTTSSPPNWIRYTSLLYSSPEIDLPYAFCESNGTIVGPECPPTTGITVSLVVLPVTSLRKRAARTTSREVTPNKRRGSKTPAFSSVLATIGTVELTGFEITKMCASGETLPTDVARSRTIDAFVYTRRSDD